MLFSGLVYAHQMTPAYPELKLATVEGILKASVTIFNKRADVSYYEVGVFDKEFKPIPFVTSYYIKDIPYEKTAEIDVYILDKNKDRAVYVCSSSKLTNVESTGIESRICSKFKK